MFSNMFKEIKIECIQLCINIINCRLSEWKKYHGNTQASVFQDLNKNINGYNHVNICVDEKKLKILDKQVSIDIIYMQIYF